MTTTIVDTMSNANGLFYGQMVAKKEELNLKKVNDAKEPLLRHLAGDEDSFNAFKFVVEAMYGMNDKANYVTHDE